MVTVTRCAAASRTVQSGVEGTRTVGSGAWVSRVTSRSAARSIAGRRGSRRGGDAAGGGGVPGSAGSRAGRLPDRSRAGRAPDTGWRVAWTALPCSFGSGPEQPRTGSRHEGRGPGGGERTLEEVSGSLGDQQGGAGGGAPQ